MGKHHVLHEIGWHPETRIPHLGVRPDYAVRVDAQITGYIEDRDSPAVTLTVEAMGLAEKADQQLHASTTMVPMVDSGPGPSGRSTFHQPSTSWYSGCGTARPSAVISRP